MTFSRSIKQTTVIMAVLSLIGVLTISVGASVARAAGSCSQTNNDDGTVTLTWDADGDDKWAVRAGVPGNNVEFAIVRTTPTFTGGVAGDAYTIRYVRQGGIEVPCTVPVDPPPPADFCIAELADNGDVKLTISDNDAKSWAWRRGKDGADTSYKGEIEGFSAVDPAPGEGVYVYEVISRLGAGVSETDQCAIITIEGATPTPTVCSATLQDDGSVTVTWDDNQARNWSIRRGINGATPTYLAIGDNFAYSDNPAPQGIIEYVIRAKFADNNRIDASCGTVTNTGEAPVAVTCTAIEQDNGDIELSWDDNDANKWSIRRARNGGPTSFKGEVDTPGFIDTAVPVDGTVSYEIVSRFSGGVKLTSTCTDITPN